MVPLALPTNASPKYARELETLSLSVYCIEQKLYCKLIDQNYIIFDIRKLRQKVKMNLLY